MKKTFFAALLALPILAVAARAEGCAPGSANFGANVGVGVSGYWGPGCCGPGGCGPGGFLNGPGGLSGPAAYYLPGQLGPWYLYWPMEAHFQTPAPTGYPYWPSPMGLPPGPVSGAPAPGNFMPASYQAPAPYYWSR